MVDVTANAPTLRSATARGLGRCYSYVSDALCSGITPKGDVLAITHIAGIQAAKRTAELEPLDYIVGAHGAFVDLEIVGQGVLIEVTVRTADRTGVEMEALTAVSVAALAVVEKTGGRSGAWYRDFAPD